MGGQVRVKIWLQIDRWSKYERGSRTLIADLSGKPGCRYRSVRLIGACLTHVISVASNSSRAWQGQF